MAPFIVLTVTFLVLLVASRAGAPDWRWRWYTSLRIALAAMFMLTASAHFSSMRGDLIRMVPPFFPSPGLIVTLTGVAEIAGAVGLLIPRVAPWAAAGLSVLMLAMFPANVYAALHSVTLDGRAPTPLVLRTMLQVVFIGAAIVAAVPERAAATLHKRARRPAA